MPELKSAMARRVVEVCSVRRKRVGLIGQASKFSGNVGAIVVEIPGLVVAKTRVSHRAAIERDDEQNKAILAVTHVVDRAAPRVHAHPAINFADPANQSSFIFHRVDERPLRCRKLHRRCERDVASQCHYTCKLKGEATVSKHAYRRFIKKNYVIKCKQFVLNLGWNIKQSACRKKR